MPSTDLTILVTIRGRRNTLPRVMNYYKSFPAKVIYVDSTPESSYEFAHMASPHTYIHVPQKSYIQKLSDCLAQVDTKYCIIMCDDDFLTRTSALYSTKFLEENKNFVACWGQEVSLRDNCLVAETYDYLAKFLPTFDKPTERVRNCWRHFNGGLVHALCRTEALRKIFDFHIENKELDAIRYFDKTFAFCLSALGNVKCLPLCHAVRSDEESNPSLLRTGNPSLTENWRPHLRFNNDFKNHDLNPLANLVGSDVSFIYEIHGDLCRGDYRRSFHFNLMKQKPTRVQDFRDEPDKQYKIEGRTLYASYGSGGDYNGNEGYYQESSMRCVEFAV